MLRLADAWIWDFWLADDGERFHLFMLKASRALVTRIAATGTSIGHAVSTDLPLDRVRRRHRRRRSPRVRRPVDVDRIDRRGTTDIGGCSTPATERRRARAQAAHRARHLDRPDHVDEAPATAGRERPPLVRVHRADEVARRSMARPLGVPRSRRRRLAHADHRPGDAPAHTTTAASSAMPARPTSYTGRSYHRSASRDRDSDSSRFPKSRPSTAKTCCSSPVSKQQLADPGGPAGGVWCVPVADRRGPYEVEHAEPITDERLYSGRLVATRDGQWVLLAFRNVDHADRRRETFIGELTDPMRSAGTPAAPPSSQTAEERPVGRPRSPIRPRRGDAVLCGSRRPTRRRSVHTFGCRRGHELIRKTGSKGRGTPGPAMTGFLRSLHLHSDVPISLEVPGLMGTR